MWFYDNQYLFLGLLLVLLFCLYYFYRTRHRGRKVERRGDDLNEGLCSIIEGNDKRALEYLQRAAKYQPENIIPYVYIGNILRRFNNFDKAVEVHKSLLSRPELRDSDLVWIRREIITDLLGAGLYQHVREEVALLLELTQEPSAMALKAKIQEYLENWDDAYKTWASIKGDYKDDLHERMALLKVENGNDLLEMEKFHDARVSFKEAIKVDQDCTPAYIMIGDAYYSEGNIEKAIDRWEEFCEAFPRKAYVVFEKLEDAYFQLKKFEDIIPLYEMIFEKSGYEIHISYALARIYIKMGEYDAAATILEKINDFSEPTLSLVLIELYKKTDDAAKIDAVLEQWDTALPYISAPFVCSNCSYESEELIWRCPQCEEWGLFKI